MGRPIFGTQYQSWLQAHGLDLVRRQPHYRNPEDYELLAELVELVNVHTRDDGIAVEIFEDMDPFFRVRVFRPTPGPDPEESIVELLMGIDGETPSGEPLIQLVYDTDPRGDNTFYTSPSPLAIATILLHRP